MRVVVSGAAGLVGRAVVRVLRGRGDTVIALVRDPAKAPFLAEMGAELVRDDLSDVARLTGILAGADGLVHAAGSYRIGISASDRPTMWDANVGTATRTIDAAIAAGVARIVDVSTVNVFGDTHGRIVDEGYRRDLDAGFLSWYDETKCRAHEVAEQRIAAGAPVVIVQPSQVYGPSDHSGFGEQLRQAHAGTLRYRALDDVEIGLVHVDDLATGIVAALDRGRVGEAYILSGPALTLRDVTAIAARLGGHEPPRFRIPVLALRAMARLGRLIGRAGLAEIVSASAGVTYLASSAKAERELGFRVRAVETGLRDTFDTAGSGPGH